MQTLQEAREQENKELLAQQIILDEFEKSQMGVLSKAASVRTKGVTGSAGASSPGSPATPGESNGKSRCLQERHDAILRVRSGADVSELMRFAADFHIVILLLR